MLKLLSREQMETSVEALAGFIKIMEDKGRSILNNIITMDESAVAEKGLPGPAPAKVVPSPTRQMELVLFDNNGMIYTNYIRQGDESQCRVCRQAPDGF